MIKRDDIEIFFFNPKKKYLVFFVFQTLATNFFETISVLANISTDFDPICPIMICWKLVLKKTISNCLLRHTLQLC